MAPFEGGTAVKGENLSTNNLGYGVMGTHNGTGWTDYFQDTTTLQTNGEIQVGGNGVGTTTVGKVLKSVDANATDETTTLTSSGVMIFS